MDRNETPYGKALQNRRNVSDVLIIGGGIIGCATAYYLAKRGFSVTVLEKSMVIGDGGSGRNGGGVRQSGRDPRELPLAIWGIRELWPGLSEELQTDCEYHQGGNLRLARTQEHLKILNELTESAVKCGLDVKMIGRKEVKEINPYLSDEVIGASWCPTDGHANPLTTTLGYYRAARRRGVRFVTGTDIKFLYMEKGKIAGGVTGGKEIYYAEKVLLAAGFASRKIANTVGIDIPMYQSREEALVTEAQPAMFEQMLGTAEAGSFYGHQTEHGSFVFGGRTGREEFPPDYHTNATSSVSGPALCRAVIRYFPALAGAKIVRTWAGWLDMSMDGIPVLGEVEEIPGLYLACAFTGHGFGIAPAVGYNLAGLMATGHSDVDLREFHYSRFDAGAAI